MKPQHLVMLLILIPLTACSSTPPSEDAIQTAIAQTAAADESGASGETPSATSVPDSEVPNQSSETQQWTAQDVLDTFIAAGLVAESTRPMTVDDFPAGLALSDDGIRFFIPSLCAECGGRIMSFDNEANLQATKAYYDELGNQNAAFASWVFVQGNILVQINGDLPEDQANQYGTALKNIGNIGSITPFPTLASQAGTSRENPVPLGESYTFVGFGTVSIVDVQWQVGQAGRAIVQLTLACERPADQSCKTVNYLYTAIGGSGTVYDQAFGLDVPEPSYYLQEVFGDGSITGYMAFDITQPEDTLVLRIEPFSGQSIFFNLLGEGN